MRALFSAASGMEAQQLRIDSIANNLANVSTTGFKKSRTEFEDLFYETIQMPGATSESGTELPTGIQVGHGVRLASIGRVFSTGDRVATNNPMDLAIDGEGFFQIQKEGGETLYTRDGEFKKDGDGNLVTKGGDLILPTITIPTDATNVTILPDGTVNVTQAGSATPTQVGQLELARFANAAGLMALGGNRFAVTEASGFPETGTPDENGFGALSSGYLEGSNVNVAEELVQMILAQRAFEVNSRVIRAGDEMLRTASQLTA
ncbi:MAG: flagellar basal-body rod protein FlgG [Myxococcota bacterium]|jgi:flagellar basal-body rod protein FlgG|nr:flagellar basal-body rod protein FlgG [Myxococcota bacterium]